MQDFRIREAKRSRQRKAARKKVKQAPGALETVRKFVNTMRGKAVVRGKHVDELATPAQLGRWFEHQGLLATGTTLNAVEQQRGLDLRQGLRALILANTGLEPNPETLQRLAVATAAGRFVLRFEAGVPAGFGPASNSFDDALAALAAVVVTAQLEGHWSRLKVCQEQNCGQVFFDSAQSLTGRWCSPQCGDRARAAIYRRRRRR